MNHWKSKKWTAAILGSVAVLFIFAVTVMAVLLALPEKASHLTGLANIATVALSALITSLVAGQSCVDWRHRSEVRQGDFLGKRVFAAKHYDDPTIS